ncbi:MAG: GFA family protein [Hyphomonadaceae bacterium]
MEASVHQGGCHCGAVRYETPPLPERHSVCCCIDCRRTAGAPMVAWAIYPKDAVKVMKGAPKSRASSEHAQRFFCPDCGTGLFYVSETYLPGKIDVASATLDEPERIGPPAAVVQTADRIGWAADIHTLPQYPRYPGMS